jgi:eukaryotic-like serine/threonine-protein kinase
MSAFDKSRWQILSPLLDELLDLEPAERRTRLEAISAEDPALSAELQALLDAQADIERDGFLARGAANPNLPGGLAGQVIDRYTLDRQIGEGGMGAVWLAHRSDGRYEGEVAIKFLSLPAMGPAGLQRFAREGQVLAKLQHPNIAHLLDAGVTAAGQPYLVIEYVQGEPLDAWCAAHSLDIDARIELFLQVLAAVAHAHGKLILHRDLKPSNILVTRDGQVKLLDFGIAKFLEDETKPAQMTEMTKLAGQAFTLDYAAPEQIQGADVTTATDVYSLGVLLYVVLTDQHPTAGDSVTPAERIRAVLDTEPKRPSAMVSKTGGRATRSLADRAKALRGDLDNIVTKALKKAPIERYPTVDAFAQDLRRYLSNEPVSARPDSVTYRVQKFVARHAVAVIIGTLVIAALTAATVISVQQASEAKRQRDRALALSARNSAVVDFVSTMLTEGAPDDQPVRLSELLERSQQLLVTGDADPDHQAAILDLLAEYHLSAGNPAKAQPLLQRALVLTEHSTDAALKATLICNDGHVKMQLNERDESLKELERGIAMSRVDPLAAARCLQKRAYLANNFNDPDDSIRYTLEAQASLRQSPLRRPEQEASMLGDLAYAYYLSGKTAEADRYYAEALAQYEKLNRAESPATFSLRNNWGIASFAAGDNQRALENYDEALRIARKRNPEADPPAYLLSNRALALASLARYPESLAAFDEALAAAKRSENVASELHALVNRAGTYLLMGEVDKAAHELADIDANYAGMIPPDSVPAVSIQHIKGRLATERGDLEQALAELNAAIDFFDKRDMAVAPVTRALIARAEVRVKARNIEAAREDAQRAVNISRKLQDQKPHSSLTGLSLLELAEVESAAGAAGKSRELAREAVPHLESTLGATHPQTLRAKMLAAIE